MDSGVRQWFGARRLVLKARYVVRARAARLGADVRARAARRSHSTPFIIGWSWCSTAAYGRPIAIATIERRRLDASSL